MRVAIIHYWLVAMRGGEKVLEALCRLYPQADIFTHVVAPDVIASSPIASHTIKTSFISALPAAKTRYKSYLPFMPLALEQLDLRNYDLILSSESGPSKGVIPPAGALHICYCHSPMRYIWNMFHDYREKSGPLTRLLMAPASHYVRNWDVISASRVHHFVANSRTVAHRLRTYYGRDATVINPPVDTESFERAPSSEVGDHYLMVGELVRYKRPDLVVEAFNKSGRRLVVIGGGDMLPALRKMARPNVEILGPQPFESLRRHYARCRALIFAGEEDFGIVPVEAMASGRPVIAYNRGGATETVVEGVTGTFFNEQTADSLGEAITRLDDMRLDPRDAIARAREFRLDRFLEEMKTFIDLRLEEHTMAPRMIERPPRAAPVARLV